MLEKGPLNLEAVLVVRAAGVVIRWGPGVRGTGGEEWGRQLVLSGKRDPQAQLDSIRQLAAGAQREESFRAAGRTEEQPASYLQQETGKTENLAAAASLNREMRGRSAEAALLLVNLPRPPASPHSMRRYMAKMELLLAGLPPALLVRGS